MNNSMISYFVPVGILCMLWVAGMGLALFRIKQAPRTAILFFVALFLLSLSALANAYLIVSANNVAIYQFLGRSVFLINTILRFIEPTTQIIGWILIFAAFFLPASKTPKNNSSEPGKWEFSIKFNNPGNS
ncbi:MAG: hypothetical protein U0X74_11160 [Anaerolineales bacterium]